MQQFERSRDEQPYFQLQSTGDAFEQALRMAVRDNVRSMNELHATVTVCVRSLRGDGMQCEAAMLTMKSFMRDVVRRHSIAGVSQLRHADFMVDQVVRWCVADFYEAE